MTTNPRPDPRDPARDARTLGEIQGALDRRDMQRAADLAEAALVSGLEHPLALNVTAYRLEQEGRYAEALARLGRAHQLAPADVMTLNAIGLCLMKQDRGFDAVKAFDAALAIDPGLAQAHYHRGIAFEGFGDFEGARSAYERSASLAPDSADPLAALAALAIRTGDLEQGQAFVDRALAIDPDHAPALGAQASAELARREFEAAETRLRAVLVNPGLDRFDRPAILTRLGDALDGEQRTQAAFDAYTAAKDETRALHAARMAQRPERELDIARRLQAFVQATPAAAWVQPDRERESDARTHVFLAGFPRSGTTLLETVLASHPDVAVLDERDAITDADVEFIRNPAGLQALQVLSGEDLALFRSAYWGRIRAFGLDVWGRTLIDKMPLHTVKLPLIAKLFPSAKVLFARRDPRDVVLSCFRRSFAINPSMFEFVTLEGTARFYDAVMWLAELYREKLPLQVHVLRYEDLVADFEARAREVCDFADLEWNEAMRDFAATARARAIRTPSAAQVRRGLYTQGMGQWRRYRDQLAPVLPILQPWVEAFGYDPD